MNNFPLGKDKRRNMTNDNQSLTSEFAQENLQVSDNGVEKNTSITNTSSEVNESTDSQNDVSSDALLSDNQTVEQTVTSDDAAISKPDVAAEQQDEVTSSDVEVEQLQSDDIKNDEVNIVTADVQDEPHQSIIEEMSPANEQTMEADNNEEANVILSGDPDVERDNVQSDEDISSKESSSENTLTEEEMKDKRALLEHLKLLLDRNVLEVKDQVELIKAKFYLLYNEEQRTLKEKAEEAAERIGEKLTDWQPVVDELEKEFKEVLNAYKSKRTDALKRIEEELNNNLLRKENIISQLKDIADADTADVMDNVRKVKELQTEWKKIGHIPPQKKQEINKQYTTYLEKFYDLVKINFELRDLDFKKNLELKTILCEAAEKLKDNPSVVEASRSLQLLHEEWAEIGPVAKEFRESIWLRFKEASTVINKKYQTYFEELHAKEEENLKRKQTIIDKIKEIDIKSLTSNRLWLEATEKITELQDLWRTIGFAPKKYNTSIYEEYRSLCNDFFVARSAYFKEVRDTLSQNLAKKTSLVDKVVEINSKMQEYKNSEDWKKATDQILALQKEWRTIGSVVRKYSDDVWKRFSVACDEFFTQKREILKEVKNENKRMKDTKMMESGDVSLLTRMRDNLQQQIKTAENNILFFSGKSNSAVKLVEDMQKKIDDLKKQLADIKDKIKNIDNNRQQSKNSSKVSSSPSGLTEEKSDNVEPTTILSETATTTEESIAEPVGVETSGELTVEPNEVDKIATDTSTETGTSTETSETATTILEN